MATNLFFILGLLIATARVGLIKAQANIDTRVPIVRISPDSENNDAFGFALALHRIEQVNDTDDLMTAVSKARYEMLAKYCLQSLPCSYGTV